MGPIGIQQSDSPKGARAVIQYKVPHPAARRLSNSKSKIQDSKLAIESKIENPTSAIAIANAWAFNPKSKIENPKIN
jgi:hypothetical protein